MERYSLEAAMEEAEGMKKKVDAGEAKDYGHGEQLVRLESHLADLRASGLYGLEGRVQRGLDPAGMLAVKETRTAIEELMKKASININEVDTLTKALHVGAIWSKADDLSKAEKPEVRAWMLLADECHEVNDKDLSTDEYLHDVDRIDADLKNAQQDPEAAIEKAVQNIVATAKEKFIKKDGVPFSEEDAFLHMAIAGEKFGVCKSGDLYFSGADQLDYSILEAEGLTAIEKEDRGRVATFFQREGKDVVKKLYPGLAIVFGDEELARRLAKTAETFLSESKL